MSLADRDRPLPPPAARVVDDDEEAIVEAARHDRAAFAELYRRHVRAVYGYCYRLTGSSQVAEDLTSATFERALRGLDGFRWQGTGIRPWLLRIAANEANGRWRREARAAAPRAQRALRLVAGDGTAPPVGADDGVDGFDHERLRAALATLPERYQQAITLRYLGGLSADEAAAAAGCSKANLAVTLHRALGALRRALDVREDGGA